LRAKAVAANEANKAVCILIAVEMDSRVKLLTIVKNMVSIQVVY